MCSIAGARLVGIDGQAVPEQVRLYLGDTPSDTTVVWTTFNSTTANLVQYGTEPGAYTSALVGTEYTYDVGVGGSYAQWARRSETDARAVGCGGAAGRGRRCPEWQQRV